MTIEGIPDGWELVRIGEIQHGEFFIQSDGSIEQHDENKAVRMNKNYVIIRKIEKPKQYRPFANAADAESFFDRKLKYKEHDGSVLRICFLSSKGVHVSKYDYTYEEAFVVFECTDGTPFGIEVIE